MEHWLLIHINDEELSIEFKLSLNVFNNLYEKLKKENANVLFLSQKHETTKDNIFKVFEQKIENLENDDFLTVLITSHGQNNLETWKQVKLNYSKIHNGFDIEIQAKNQGPVEGYYNEGIVCSDNEILWDYELTNVYLKNKAKTAKILFILDACFDANLTVDFNYNPKKAEFFNLFSEFLNKANKLNEAEEHQFYNLKSLNKSIKNDFLPYPKKLLISENNKIEINNMFLKQINLSISCLSVSDENETDPNGIFPKLNELNNETIGQVSLLEYLYKLTSKTGRINFTSFNMNLENKEINQQIKNIISKL